MDAKYHYKQYRAGNYGTGRSPKPVQESYIFDSPLFGISCLKELLDKQKEKTISTKLNFTISIPRLRQEINDGRRERRSLRSWHDCSCTGLH